jgi:hypothetical protein
MTVLHRLVRGLTTPAPFKSLTAVQPLYTPPFEVIRYLLTEGGVRIDSRDIEGRTALDYLYEGVSLYCEDYTWNMPNCFAFMWWRHTVKVAECILDHSRLPVSQEMVDLERDRLGHARQEAERTSKEDRNV